MSAQRKSRPVNPRNPGHDRAVQKSSQADTSGSAHDRDWAETQGDDARGPANRIGFPQADSRGSNRSQPSSASIDQGGSRWNQRQNPEHPERPADGGKTEMRGNAGSNEQQSGDPDSPDQPESGDRGRGPARRRLES